MLFYHKCTHCLSPFSCSEKKVNECDCGGPVRYMGQVKEDSYVLTEDKPACDGRCTHASGPSCNCKCGGKNHGTGKVVQTVTAEGKVKATGFSEEDIKKGHEYRRLRDLARKLYDDKWNNADMSKSGGYNLRFKDRKNLERINKLKIYSTRDKQLREFIDANRHHEKRDDNGKHGGSET